VKAEKYRAGTAILAVVRHGRDARAAARGYCESQRLFPRGQEPASTQRGDDMKRERFASFRRRVFTHVFERKPLAVFSIQYHAIIRPVYRQNPINC